MVEETPKKTAMEYFAIAEEYKKNPDADGNLYTANTAQAIAWERAIETKREDALFKDELAQHLVGPRGEEVSTMINVWISGHACPDAPDIHIRYTAARTKLINDHLTSWVTKMAAEGKKCQVACLGAGMDTRAFFMECLAKVQKYTEVDVQSINDFKTKKIAESGAKAHCERSVISMDFSKESTKDLPTHGFDPALPTCWILEGLVMYLQEPEVAALLKELSDLSASGSYLILNYLNNPAVKDPYAPSDIKGMGPILKEKGWVNEKDLYFGQEGFNFGRFPEGIKQTAMENFGFAFYDKA